ncbi:MAG: hypothetical protein V3S29_13865 [bacterium]
MFLGIFANFFGRFFAAVFCGDFSPPVGPAKKKVASRIKGLLFREIFYIDSGSCGCAPEWPGALFHGNFHCDLSGLVPISTAQYHQPKAGSPGCTSRRAVASAGPAS